MLDSILQTILPILADDAIRTMFAHWLCQLLNIGRTSHQDSICGGSAPNQGPKPKRIPSQELGILTRNFLSHIMYYCFPFNVVACLQLSTPTFDKHRS